MADARIEWIDADKISIRKAGHQCGFSLDEIDEFSKTVQKAVISRARKNVVKQLDDVWISEHDSPFADATGVYVVTLTDNIFVDYGDKKISPVIYIGRGAIRGRLTSHFEGSLFDFSRTLNDVNLRIFMGLAYAKGPGATYVDAEFRLIEHFEKVFGNKPLLNKNKGTDSGRKHR